MGIIDLIFPIKCLECGNPGKYICSQCLLDVEQLKLNKTPQIKSVVSVWRYQGVVRKAILAMKYKYAFAIAKELAEKFTASYQRLQLPKIDHPVLIPVPMHWRRQSVRGFKDRKSVV
jgi:predicted amidophosphoribosyltransferase